jgi:ribose 5-phosphate isomerase RpiB
VFFPLAAQESYMKIAFGADHLGFPLKAEILSLLTGVASSAEQADYPA